MIRIDVRDNLKGVALRYQRLGTDVRDKALVRALNRTATTVRAEASREIRKQYNLKSRVVKDQIRITRANRATLTAVIQASGRPIPLIEFDARWNRRMKGASVRVKHERKVVRGAFIATMPGGHRGVFVRKGDRRLPIRQLFSISLPTAFTQKQVTAAIVAAAQARFPVAIEQEMKFALSRT
jgi:hypothetical protein